MNWRCGFAIACEHEGIGELAGHLEMIEGCCLERKYGEGRSIGGYRPPVAVGRFAVRDIRERIAEYELGLRPLLWIGVVRENLEYRLQ
jgi:hypothetical protein